MPILWQDKVAGAVVLGFRNEKARGPDVAATSRDLGDRLGVAFAAAAKDEQLYLQANYDVQTGLPNRHFFKDQLSRAIAQVARENGKLALLFIDLDHFKYINDTIGHAGGDEVLRLSAERLKQCVRESDIVARLGGDEFTVIASQIRTAREAEAIVQHILEALRLPFVVSNAEQFLSASVGIAIYPADGASVDDLIRNADTAMFRAKESGRDRFCLFRGGDERGDSCPRDARPRATPCSAAKRVPCGVSAAEGPAQGQIVGTESLVRWQHPERGLLTPDQFIDVAEAVGLVEPIRDWVPQETCRQYRIREAQGIRFPLIAVNVSARQFRQRGFVERVESIVRDAGVS